LAYLIEAGLAARAALSGNDIRVDATRVELEQIADDGRQAWERILLSNLRLVLSVSGPAARRSGLPEDDLFQEGVWALAEALRSFNPQVARFTTHALPRIRGHVRAVAASRGGAVGLRARDAVVLRRAQAIAARIEAESGRPAPVEDVASELGRGTVWTARLLAHRQPLLTGQASDDRSPFRRPEPIEACRLDDLADRLQRLSGMQRQVLALHYGFTDGRPRSYRAISEALGISASDARRTCEAALAVLREARSDGGVRRTPGRRWESPAEARRVLGEIDRWSRKGLSLLEVAIAMRTEPEAVYEACRVSGSEALLARLTRMELRMTGPQPAGTNVLENTIRRAAATRGRSGDRTGSHPIVSGNHPYGDPTPSRPRHSPALTSQGL
jgi:RNA polymerase primary sigma factor